MEQPPPYRASGQQPQQVNISVQPGETVLIQPNVILVNKCPVCHTGVLVDEFTALGIVCAIVFFPFGILCCFMLTRKRCTNCRLCFH